MSEDPHSGPQEVRKLSRVEVALILLAIITATCLLGRTFVNQWRQLDPRELARGN